MFITFYDLDKNGKIIECRNILEIHDNIFPDPDWFSVLIARNNDNNTFILSDKYYIYSIKTIKIFNIPINFSYIKDLCRHGKVEVLEYLMNSHKNQTVNENVKRYLESNLLDLASEFNQLHVLQWSTKLELSLNYTENALDNASKNNHYDVLDWWYKSNLPLKYSKRALTKASEYSNILILEWWKHSGLELKYDEVALNYAAQCGDIEVMNWWCTSNLPLKYDVKSLLNSLINHCIPNWSKKC
jgi:hypothetical protein